MSKTDEYYKEYKYLIWRSEVGFLDLDSIPEDQIREFIDNLSSYLKKKEKEEDIYINIDSKLEV